MRIRKLLRKLWGLSSSEWRDLFAAQAALISAQFSLWLRRRGSLVSADAPADVAQQEGPVEPAVLNLARAVDRAASYGFVRAQCLARSIALSRLMESRGFDGSIVRVGVSLEGEEMLAHAWVEYRGSIIGDEESHVSRFDRLPGIDVDT